MSRTLALTALRRCAFIAFAVCFAGCAATSGAGSREQHDDDAQASRGTGVYVGQGVGGCIGFYLEDGVVTGGFVLPARRNLSHEATTRLTAEQRAMIGGTDPWPICRVTRLGNDAYRVLACGGDPNPTLRLFRLVISEVDASALFYRMSRDDEPSDVTYSGTAINVDAMATRLEASSAQRNDERGANR